jgi:alanine racemase
MRLKARVVRVEQLRAGDSVSYGRNYIAKKSTWIATIPAGHTDGMPREAVNGAHVVVNGSAYPVIGAVSASHTIIEVGSERKINIGDVATLLGPDHATIHPNQLADSTGTSVYDALMHLNPTLPKVLI